MRGVHVQSAWCGGLTVAVLSPVDGREMTCTVRNSSSEPPRMREARSSNCIYFRLRLIHEQISYALLDGEHITISPDAYHDGVREDPKRGGQTNGCRP